MSTLSPAPRIAGFTARDGYRFFVRIWDSPQPKARFFFLHGIISHGGWYEASCQRLKDGGFEVRFLDRRGSGLNAAERGVVDSFHTWISDVADYVESASADGVPAVLAGISWGGKLAAAVAKARPDLLRGLVLICPGIHALRGPGALQRALVRLFRRTPARHWRLTVPLQDPRLFTDSPAWQQAIATDPLVLRKVTLHTARESLALDEFVRDAAERIDSRTLMMLAGQDRIIDNAAMRRFHARLACPKKLIEYADAAHTFEFGPRGEQYVLDLIEWANTVTLPKE